MSDRIDESRVLIVDDDPDTLRLIRRQMKSLDAEIIEASDGQQAILTLGVNPPSMVVMDVMMPLLNGLESMRFIKGKFPESWIPVCILSARHALPDLQKASEMGCDDYITKPYTRERLLRSAQLFLKLTKLDVNLKRAASLDGEADDLLDVRAEMSGCLVELSSMLNGEGKDFIARKHLRRVVEMGHESLIPETLKGLGVK